jgi:hypothetical protein
MSGRRRVSGRLLAAAALIACLAIGAGIASASVKNVTSTATITSGSATEFKGKVTAGRKQCRAGRKVRLFVKGSGTARRDDTLVGKAKTDPDGTWSMTGTFYANLYYVQVVAELIRIHSNPFRCLFDRSPIRRY